MHKDCKQIRDMVSLWYETQMGDMKKCKEKQFEFAEMMWELYNNKSKIKEKQTMGRAIDQDNRLDDHDKRLKLIEDALEELVQTKVHHVDLHSEIDEHERSIRDVKAEGVEIEPEEKFTPPTSGKRRATPKITTPKKVESLL